MIIALAAPAYHGSREGAMVTLDEVHEALFLLGALGAAASRAATEEQRATLERYGVLVEPDPLLDAALPVRAAVIAAEPPPALADAALAFFLADPTWATVLAGTLARGEGAAGLHALLHRARPDLAPTWRALRPAWLRCQPPPARAEAAVERVRAYLRMPAALPHFTEILDPLLPAFTGVCVPRGEHEAWILRGPSRDPLEADVLLIHEITHLPLERLWRESMPVKRALHRTHELFERIEDELGYGTWPSFVMENLARALSYRIAGAVPGRGALALEVHFGHALEAYETGSGSFEEAWVTALDGAADVLVG